VAREASRAAHQRTKKAAPRLGSLMVQNQRDSVIRVSRRQGYSPYTQSFLVSGELCQPIPIMIFMVSADLIQPIPKIFCIGWVTSVDTTNVSL
jgi:hypothetical protein